MWLNPDSTYIKQHDDESTLETTRYCDKVGLCCCLAILTKRALLGLVLCQQQKTDSVAD